MLTGAFVGSGVDASPRAGALEEWLDRTLDVQPIFVTWDEDRDPPSELFGRRLPAIWAAGRVPMVTWEPFTTDPSDTPTDVSRRIARGDHDGYLDRWRSSLRAWLAGPDGELGTGDDRHLYLRLAHEPNGDWYPWAPIGGAGPGDYVRMWRTVHRSLMSGGVTTDHVRWVWAVNHADAGDTRAEDLYPGDRYVDWVGVDGFNWGSSRPWSTWQSPAAVFDGMVERLRDLAPHPVCLPEYASSSETEDGHSVRRKSRWIRDARRYLSRRPIEMALWFNTDKETDWAVFDADRGDTRVTVEGTEYTAYSAYRRAIRRLG